MPMRIGVHVVCNTVTPLLPTRCLRLRMHENRVRGHLQKVTYRIACSPNSLHLTLSNIDLIFLPAT